METLDEFLEHHGIKGQHWGIRNRSSSVKTAKKTSSDFKKSQEIRKKKHPVLSNKQIEVANRRANLEQSFVKLNPSKIKKGHDAAKTYLAVLGVGATLPAVVNSPAGKAVLKAGSSGTKKILDKAANSIVKIKF